MRCITSQNTTRYCTRDTFGITHKCYRKEGRPTRLHIQSQGQPSVGQSRRVAAAGSGVGWAGHKDNSWSASVPWFELSGKSRAVYNSLTAPTPRLWLWAPPHEPLAPVLSLNVNEHLLCVACRLRYSHCAIPL